MSINGVVQAEYLYNFQGQQVVRRLTQTGETIHSIHDLDGNRIAEYDYDYVAQTSTLIREYVWLNGLPIAVIEAGVVYYVRTDHIGRPVFATDGTGAKVWEASYLPFGGVQTSSGPNMELRFPGQWFQAESGLHQKWMRDYDPTTGRYMQADPLGLIDGASVYGYARQNPGRYVDPRGERAQCVIIGYTENGIPLLDCNNVGGQSICIGGACTTERPSTSIRDDWPEYDECISECMKSEPILDLDSWLNGSRGICTLAMGVPSRLIFGKNAKYVNPAINYMCRRDLCEDKCVTCEN